MSPEAPAPRQPGDTTGGTGDVLVSPRLEHTPAPASAQGEHLVLPKGNTKDEGMPLRALLLPWSGRVGAGRAAESAAATSTAQRMRHRQVNIPLLQLLLGDWAPQLPLHGAGPGRAQGGLRRAGSPYELCRRKAESGHGQLPQSPIQHGCTAVTGDVPPIQASRMSPEGGMSPDCGGRSAQSPGQPDTTWH